MRREYRSLPARSMFLLLTLVLVLQAASTQRATAATATETTDRPSFSIAPVGLDEGHIQLVVEPGSTRSIEIRLSNNGDGDGHARTYAGNVSSKPGGGIQIDPVGSEPTGTTRWLDYDDETIAIPAHTAVNRLMTITVPDDAAPGEYRSALVVQPTTANPAQAVGESGVYMTTTTRQAIAVNLTVPGELTPAFSIGAASVTDDGPRPLLDVTISNDGNVRVVPEGQLTLRSATGEPLLQQAVTMGSIYAWDATALRVPLSTALPVGTYSLDVQLTDTLSGTTASATAIDLIVTAPVDAAAATTNATPFLDRLGELAENQSGGSNVLLIVAVAAVILLSGVTLLLRRRSQHGTSA